VASAKASIRSIAKQVARQGDRDRMGTARQKEHVPNADAIGESVSFRLNSIELLVTDGPQGGIGAAIAFSANEVEIASLEQPMGAIRAWRDLATRLIANLYFSDVLKPQVHVYLTPEF